jgi:hypothetical protein
MPVGWSANVARRLVPGRLSGVRAQKVIEVDADILGIGCRASICGREREGAIRVEASCGSTRKGSVESRIDVGRPVPGRALAISDMGDAYEGVAGGGRTGQLCRI